MYIPSLKSVLLRGRERERERQEEKWKTLKLCSHFYIKQLKFIAYHLILSATVVAKPIVSVLSINGSSSMASAGEWDTLVVANEASLD